MHGKLFERDWHSIMEAILRISSTNDIGLLQNVSLDCLRAIVQADQYAFFISRTGGREALGEPCIKGVEAKCLDKFMTGNYLDDDDSELFFSGRHLLSHATETTRDSDQIPEEYLMSTRVYKDIYIPQGIHYGMRSKLMCKGMHVGSIELLRTKKQGDFTDKQLETMTLLAPYVANHLGFLLSHETQAVSLTPSITPEELKRAFSLTNRECEIVMLLSTGKEDHVVAEELCISGTTLKKHLYNAYKKMGISSRTQLLGRMIAMTGAAPAKDLH